MIAKHHTSVWVMAAWLLAAAQAEPSRSFETDQYLALEASIEDSSAVINQYLNEELRALLRRPGVAALDCEDVPRVYYRMLFRGLLASRLQKFLKNDPRVDRFPDGWKYREHLRKSIYRKPWFPFVLPLSPTIRLGEIRFGLDKFGHFFGFGRRYYKRYERLRGRGFSDAEAVRRVIRRGLRQERLFVGGLADGVFSHGDLEANYQGMELAKAFCRGDDPYIERAGGRWVARREIDLRDYVTPSFDESYNNNHYPRPRWKRVRPVLVAEHCERFFSPAIQTRMERYARIDRPNPSKRLIDEYFASRGRDPQAMQSMATICRRAGDSAMTAAAR